MALGNILGAPNAWFLGLAAGFLAVAVVATLVIIVLALAARIADQAKAAGPEVQTIVKHTAILTAIPSVNQTAIAIRDAAVAARRALTE